MDTSIGSNRIGDSLTERLLDARFAIVDLPNSPFVDGFLGVAKGVGILLGLILAALIGLVLLAAVYSALQWAWGAFVAHPIPGAGILVGLFAVFIYASGLWAIPFVQSLLGGGVALIFVAIISVVGLARVW